MLEDGSRPVVVIVVIIIKLVIIGLDVDGDLDEDVVWPTIKGCEITSAVDCC